ncbi:MAG TPA: hypothetical protein VFG54_12120 [Prolixibacteraceae bacterium]|nr:hypothetical protein [Prolixibacteraceae bacterium]
MTTIYASYYPAIQSGEIDLMNVNFSALVVDSSYLVDETHTKDDVDGRVETLSEILVGGDISTLSMGEITEKVLEQVLDDDKGKVAGFVVYDIRTNELCFFETIENW